MRPYVRLLLRKYLCMPLTYRHVTSSNKCHASSDRCLTSSNKEATSNKCHSPTLMNLWRDVWTYLFSTFKHCQPPTIKNENVILGSSHKKYFTPYHPPYTLSPSPWARAEYMRLPPAKAFSWSDYIIHKQWVLAPSAELPLPCVPG